jgi:carboxyl-terminal processing protease
MPGMSFAAGPLRWLLTALIGTTLAACAPVMPPPIGEADFPRLAAVETITAGYGNISEKYIESIDMDELASDGLRGLSSIDPSLSIAVLGSELLLRKEERIVARFAQPGPAGTARVWADLSVEVLLAGRRVSGDLAAASPEKIYEAIFDSALADLDVYSRYAGAEEAEMNRSRRTGYGGIGIRFSIVDGAARITEVMEETPAERAGLAVGDIITHIDGHPIDGVESAVIADLLRGPKTSRVALTVRRAGALPTLQVAVERDHVVPTTVHDRVEDGVLILTVTRFNEATTRSMSRKLKDARSRLGNALIGVILDLRGNPGGLLKQAIRTADLFLTQGEIVKTRGRHPDSIQYYTARSSDLAFGLPVVVLIDGKSASAAEIMAAALQDRGRAVVIGTTSFGKGTVQTVIRLPNEGEITLTWSRFIMPSGYALHQLGVLPLVCTSRPEDQADPVDALFAHREEAASLLSEWRTTPWNDAVHRGELRSACPAMVRQGSVEVDLARRLIHESGLYARVLGFLAPTAAAQPTAP